MTRICETPAGFGFVFELFFFFFGGVVKKKYNKTDIDFFEVSQVRNCCSIFFFFTSFFFFFFFFTQIYISFFFFFSRNYDNFLFFFTTAASTTLYSNSHLFYLFISKSVLTHTSYSSRYFFRKWQRQNRHINIL